LRNLEADDSSEESAGWDDVGDFDIDDDEPGGDVRGEPDRDQEAGDWVEDAAGWRQWRPQQPEPEEEPELDPVERCARLLLEADLFDDCFDQEVVQAKEYLSEDEYQRRREEYRVRGLRLQQEIQRAREQVSPSVWAAARRQSPYAPKETSQIPFLKSVARYQRFREQGLKGRRLHFDEKDEEAKQDQAAAAVPKRPPVRRSQHGQPRK
jgi:hypothetical protein